MIKVNVLLKRKFSLAIVTFVFGIIFLSSVVDAAPPSGSGVLRGKIPTECYANALSSYSPITDGNDNTYRQYIPSNYCTWTLTDATDVDGYYLVSNGNAFLITFINENGTTVGTASGITNAHNNPSTVYKSVGPFFGVKKIILKNTNNSSSLDVYEFDVRFKAVSIPPPVPTGLTATSGHAQVLLTWNNVDSADGYNLYRNGVKINTSLLKTESYKDEGLPFNTSYSYQITSVNADGRESLKSSEVIGTSIDTRPPIAQPTINLINATHKSIELSWDAGNPPYKVSISGGDPIVTNDNFYTFNGLDEDKAYTVSMQYTDIYDRLVKVQQSFSTKKIPPLASLEIEFVSSDHKSITVKWQSANPPYLITIDKGLPIFTDANEYTFIGLQHSRSYQINLAYTDPYDRVVQAEAIFSTKDLPPIAVPTFDLIRATFNTLEVRWTSGNAPYTVSVNDGISETATINVHKFTNLSPDTIYTVKLIYTDVYGRLVTATATFRTSPLPPPIAPKITYLNLTHDSVRLIWSLQTGYTFRVLKDGQVIASTGSVFYQVNDLTPETTYSFQVVGIDMYDQEAFSNVLSITTIRAPPPKPPPDPPQPPPKVSDSLNPDLNDANDHLVQGAKDSKISVMEIIGIIILILILVFGTLWLIRIWKKKLTKSAVNSASSRSVPTGIRPTQRAVYHKSPSHTWAKKSNGQRSPKRRYSHEHFQKSKKRYC